MRGQGREAKNRGVLTNRMGAFVAAPVALVRDETLSVNAKHLYVLLASFTSANDSEPVAFPSYGTIQRYTGWGSRTTVAQTLRELIDAGWIERRRRFSAPNVYAINPIKSPVVQKVDNCQKSRKWTSVVQKVDISSPESGPYQEVVELEVVELDVVAGAHAPARDATPAPSTPSQPKTQTPGGPPPARKTRIRGTAVVIEQSDDPRVEAWLRILGRPTITQTDAEIITRRVRIDSLDAWREALTAWASNPSWRLDMANIIDRYERIVHAATVRGRTATAPSTPEADWHASASAEALRILRERAAAQEVPA